VNPAIMRRKKLDYTSRRRATLRGYGLRFNKKSGREKLPVTIGFANVIESAAEAVEGVLYELPDELLPRLDEVERSPEHYARIEVRVDTEAGPCDALTYSAQPAQIAEGLIPSRNYVNHILAASELLSRDYCASLEKLETYSGECACCHRIREMIFVREGGNLFVLCHPCREAQQVWSDTHGRKLTVIETEAVMRHLVSSGSGYPSIRALIQEAVSLGLIDDAASDRARGARG
jgi:gamma-glutamylcyclotransferase (GGCT)/AIG2-like uncharacterized protein YtfP